MGNLINSPHVLIWVDYANGPKLDFVLLHGLDRILVCCPITSRINTRRYVSLIAQQEYYHNWYEGIYHIPLPISDRYVDRFRNLLPYLITCYVMYIFGPKKNLLGKEYILER